jgi:hypothetical protein
MDIVSYRLHVKKIIFLIIQLIFKIPTPLSKQLVSSLELYFTLLEIMET